MEALFAMRLLKRSLEVQMEAKTAFIDIEKSFLQDSETGGMELVEQTQS